MDELSIPDFLHKPPVYRDIFEQFGTDAAFLWLLRAIAVEQPHNNTGDILALEQRIDAQLNGLMSSIDTGWAVCAEGLNLQEAGEVFTAMVIAMRSRDSKRIQKAVEVGLSSDECHKGLISAMGWLPENIVTPWTLRFLNGKDMSHKLLGLATCSIRRQDPGEVLNQILLRDECKSHEALYSRALRLVGELRRQDCMPALLAAIVDERDSIRFWANWSAVLLGQQACLQQLKTFVLDHESPFQNLALQLCFRVLSVDQGRAWISTLAKDENQMRAVIKATGILGDPHAVNWLITKMSEPTLAKLAGEAFSFITGADLVKNKLTTQQPTAHPMQENDELDDDIELDDDENLPYPDDKKVAMLWRSHGQKFLIGRRYFIGQVASTAWLKSILNNGTQRQRHAASMELALHENNVQLPNTRARITAL
jgi:uncharacterized protein (TIGR02270 family)